MKAKNKHHLRDGLARLARAGLPLLLLAGSGCGLRPAREEIPVLMYHHVAAEPGGDVWTVSTAEFRRQIADLKAAGYRTLLPKDLARAYRWKFWLPRKPVIITFDDGLLSVKTEAEPILREAGFQAISYLITGFIADAPAERMQYRSYDCLTWEEVKGMLDRGTIAFGIHSHSHAPNPGRLAKEVGECRHIFKRKTGIKTRDFCYPYGSAPDLLRQAVTNGGYRTAMICEDQLFTNAPDADLFRIPRVSVYGGVHGFAVSAESLSPDGVFSAEVKNDGVALPVRGALRDAPSGQTWLLPPGDRLGPAPQRWCWTNLPPGLAARSLQVEIQEQNGLFGYHP